MRLLFPIQDCFERIFSKKIVIAVFAVLFVTAMIFGIVFIKTPAIYGYHLERCDKFVNRVVYSNRSVFKIFGERLLSSTLILLLLTITGVHPVTLSVTPVVFVFRGYTFGGSLAIFFSVYKASGALIVFLLYLPVHILLDVVFLASIALSFSRARCFRFAKRDFLCLFKDFAVMFVFLLVVCLVEMLLLLILFHPIGNII